MNQIIALLLFVFSIYLAKAGIKFRDDEAAGYLTKIRLFGSAVLMMIAAIFLFLKQ
jgi:hypothetical protein